MKLDSKRIEARRKQLRMTYEEIGDKCGVSKSTAKRWCDGNVSNMRIDNFNKLAEVLNVNEAWLIGYDVPMAKGDTEEEENKAKRELQEYLQTSYNLTDDEITTVFDYLEIEEARQVINAIYFLNRKKILNS